MFYHAVVHILKVMSCLCNLKTEGGCRKKIVRNLSFSGNIMICNIIMIMLLLSLAIVYRMISTFLPPFC